MCEQVASELTAMTDRLMSSLSLQRQSFEQQIEDSEQLINDTADQLCRFVENERRRLLVETNAIRRNTIAELDKVEHFGQRRGYIWKKYILKWFEIISAFCFTCNCTQANRRKSYVKIINNQNPSVSNRMNKELCSDYLLKYVTKINKQK